MGKSDYKPIDISDRNLVILTEELWKPIKIHRKKTRYEISSYGRVYNKERGIYMKLRPNKKGYLLVSLSLHGKNTGYAVHRLVAKAFVPNPKHRPQVNHIDGNITNNRFDNLEWVTDVQNHTHAVINGLMPSKLTETQVREICELLMENKLSYQKIANKYGVSPELIRCIHEKKRNAWKRITKDYDFPIKRKFKTKAYVRKICKLLKQGLDVNTIAKECGIYRAYIDRIRRGLMHKDITCDEFGFGTNNDDSE